MDKREPRKMPCNVCRWAGEIGRVRKEILHMGNERTEDMRLDDIFEEGKNALLKLLDGVSGETNTGCVIIHAGKIRFKTASGNRDERCTKDVFKSMDSDDFVREFARKIMRMNADREDYAVCKRTIAYRNRLYQTVAVNEKFTAEERPMLQIRILMA